MRTALSQKIQGVILAGLLFSAAIPSQGAEVKPKKAAPKTAAPQAAPAGFVTTYANGLEKEHNITVTAEQRARLSPLVGTFDDYTKRRINQINYIDGKQQEVEAIGNRLSAAIMAKNVAGIKKAMADHRKLLESGPEGVFNTKVREILTAAQRKAWDDFEAETDRKQLEKYLKNGKGSK